ncbi:hypothetical protein ACFL0Y_01375 [Patescibacteria group bacterium]
MPAIKKSGKYFTLFKKKWLYLLVILLVAIAFFLNSAFNKDDTSQTPLNITLWVWERPENLYFMKDEPVTYAYLAGTATKTDNGLSIYFRRQPLRIPDGSQTMATVRIEDKSQEATFEDSDIEEISDFIVGACLKDRENISCQIDFDAAQSQIDFYKELILVIRKKLPQRIKLSITALLSWCTDTDEPWFIGLPVDEAVPMFFRLGKNTDIYRRKIDQGELVLDSQCQKSIGVSTDEPLPGKKYLQDKKIYIFNNNYWDEDNWGIIKSDIERILDEE